MEETYFENQFENFVKILYEKSNTIVSTFIKTTYNDVNAKINIPKDFEREFFRLIDKVNLSLMEDKDNFYGYFLFQMSREIKFDLSSPTGVNFKGAKYVIYFNPIIFLTLNLKQMETTIKHEILHILSMHLIRAKEFKDRLSTLAVNMAKDVVVNTYLDYLPPYATTLEWVNLNYSLNLLPFESFEYYAEKLQEAIDLLEDDEDAAEDDSKKDYSSDMENSDYSNDISNSNLDSSKNDSNKHEQVETKYNPEKTHNLWEESGDIDEKTLKEFTEKFIDNSRKVTIPDYLGSIISALKNSRNELPWNLYLKKLMGTIESNKKKTITRRNRRQPSRLDLRGELRSHKAKIVVALDISGSISDEEFNQAIKEVLNIVKNYNHEITIIECDSEIRRMYKIKSVNDIRDRINIRGGTKFSPVFEYANNNKINLLVYFTDGKGEDRLQSIPKGYKTLWIISGRGDKLSLKEPFGVVKKLSNIKIKDYSLDMSDLMRDGYSMNSQEESHI